MPGFKDLSQFVVKNAGHKYVQAFFFMGGFVYDSLTLTRIDRLSDNLILLVYLLLLGLCIVLTGRIQLEKMQQSWILCHQKYIPLVIQFLLGSLFSAYVVFYVHSASWTKTAIFVVILIGLLVANEFLKDRANNIPLLTTLYFFVTMSFTTFFLPVMTGLMNRWLFILGATLSLVPPVLLLGFIYGWQIKKELTDQLRGAIGIGSTFLLLLLFYFLNWIPPVPLALKFGGIYHQVQRQETDYHLTYVAPSWYAFWSKSENPFYYRAGDRVYCFASIFAPVALKTDIVHVWQHYADNKGWQDTGRIGYAVTGGREGGYRGYTYKQTVAPGAWRVHVETSDGRLLGTIRFEIVTSQQDSLKFVTIKK